jgi:hypothetical protein
MKTEAHEYTVVVKNNIPEKFIGVPMADLFGFKPVFVNDDYGVKIQWQLFYNILEAKSMNRLFEFRTATNFIISQRIGDAEFFDIIYKHLLTAINGFNWHFEKNNSFLTMGKTFDPVPTVEEIESPVKLSYLSLNIPS